MLSATAHGPPPSSGVQASFRLDRGAFSLDASLDLEPGSVTALFGPSGSGKTTLIRCLAGLERARPGLCVAAGETWQDEERGLFLPPHRRAVGVVFQESRLFEHLTVEGNLLYGFRRTPPAERRITPEWAAGRLRIEPLMSRRTADLSGGERQRVAIARALLVSPRLLLMDEPLASLDAAAKSAILGDLDLVRRELGITVLYVSHSLEEVARAAGRMALIERGRITGAGPLAEMLTRLDLAPAHLEDAGAVIEATLAGHDPEFHLSYLEFPGGRLAVPRREGAPGDAARVRIAARDVSLALERPRRTSILNILEARVTDIGEPPAPRGSGATSSAAESAAAMSGYELASPPTVADPARAETAAQLTIRLECGGSPLLARITHKSARDLALAPGMTVFAQIKGVALVR